MSTDLKKDFFLKDLKKANDDYNSGKFQDLEAHKEHLDKLRFEAVEGLFMGRYTGIELQDAGCKFLDAEKNEVDVKDPDLKNILRNCYTGEIVDRKCAINPEALKKLDEDEFKTLTQYGYLLDVFDQAYDQAANGKGQERHANGLLFEKQPMQTISSLLGTNHGLLFQAVKKIQESSRMDKERAIKELLGAINYIAGAIIYLEEKKESE